MFEDIKRRLRNRRYRRLVRDLRMWDRTIDEYAAKLKHDNQPNQRAELEYLHRKSIVEGTAVRLQILTINMPPARVI